MSQKRVYLFGNGKAEGNAKMREDAWCSRSSRFYYHNRLL